MTSPTTPKEIRFYRANGPYGFLSNLYRAPVVFEARRFDHSEAAYQYGKPAKESVANWIVSAPEPSLCAMVAHGLLAFQVNKSWGEIKVQRMRDVLRAKFTQNHELRRMLLATGDAKLVEESNTDAFWGIGKKGDGKNMLGVLLMELRKALRQEAA
jgi:ribA/ribD-fused uncharacterized protein